MKIYIVIIICVLLILISYHLTEYERMTNTEAVQAIASLYNSANLTSTNITATGNLSSGNITTTGALSAATVASTGNMTTGGNLAVTGTTTLTGAATAKGNLTVGGTIAGNLKSTCRTVTNTCKNMESNNNLNYLDRIASSGQLMCNAGEYLQGFNFDDTCDYGGGKGNRFVAVCCKLGS